MTDWTMERKHHWCICADGREIQPCDNKEEAEQLLEHILQNLQ